MVQVPLFHCSSASVGADSILHQEPRISLELKNNVFVKKNPFVYKSTHYTISYCGN